MLRAVLSIIFIFFFPFVHAQQIYHLTIVPADKDTVTLHKLVKYRSIVSDSITATRELASVFNQLYNQGFLLSSVDSFKTDSNQLTVFIHIKKQVEWAFLSKGNVNEDLLSRINLKTNSFAQKKFYYKEVKSIEEKLVTYCENNGYPFAKVWLDSIVWKENLLSASLMIDKGKLITIDSIKVDGDVKIAGNMNVFSRPTLLLLHDAPPLVFVASLRLGRDEPIEGRLVDFDEGADVHGN